MRAQGLTQDKIAKRLNISTTAVHNAIYYDPIAAAEKQAALERAQAERKAERDKKAAEKRAAQEARKAAREIANRPRKAYSKGRGMARI